MNSLRGRLGLLLALLPLTACVHTSPDLRLQAVQAQAQSAGWQESTLPSAPFALTVFARSTPQGAQPQWASLRVYIEGDGLAWIDPVTPSLDPTPANALALRLAMQDNAPHVVYLGRPCQYVRGAARQGCAQHWWTSHRFAPEIMASTHAALDLLKTRYQAQTLELVGYSGGATVAAVMAAQRRDVTRLVTVAGNLAPNLWTKLNGLTPLVSVVSPSDLFDKLQRVPQQHFAGDRDMVISPAVIQHYLATLPPGMANTLTVIPGFDHQCCWIQAWPELLRQAFPGPAVP